MPAKKTKAKKKPAKRKSAVAKKTGSASRPKAKKRPKKAAKTAAKKAAASKKKSSPAGKSKASPRGASQRSSSWGHAGAKSSRRAADSEKLSRIQQADSESVDELVEEGNIFEAGAVAGVEQADDEDGREVHTRQVPEDDVPEEYLDRD